MVFPEKKNTCWIAGSALMGSYPRSDTKITQFVLPHFLLRKLNFHLAMELTNLKFEFQISVAVRALVFSSFTCRLEFQANYWLANFPFLRVTHYFNILPVGRRSIALGEMAWRPWPTFELGEKSGCCVSNLFCQKINLPSSTSDHYIKNERNSNSN